jgi:hypothetical protein
MQFGNFESNSIEENKKENLCKNKNIMAACIFVFKNLFGHTVSCEVQQHDAGEQI